MFRRHSPGYDYKKSFILLARLRAVVEVCVVQVCGVKRWWGQVETAASGGAGPGGGMQ